MDAHYTSGGAPAAGTMPPQQTSPSPVPPQWYEQQMKQGGANGGANAGAGGEVRSVTPAMNNTRGGNRNPQYPSRVPSPSPQTGIGAHYNNRATTPQRYYGAYNAQENGGQMTPGQPPQQQQPAQPSAGGLIRLTLRKPMGIVFEPMYDPNQPSVQRGVRICDLPRTGAAAMSRTLEVGDELLSINDKTMSRLTFDEIMDFIIEADPEQVNLLFRRPRRESLAARSLNKPNNNSTSVKWIDDDQRKKKEKARPSRNSSRGKRGKKDEDDTVQSAEESAAEPVRRRKSRGRRGEPYENESFLDLLIDALCANPEHVCKSRRNDDDYYSDDEDDRTFTSQDDSTYVTYESDKKPTKKKSRGQNRDDDSSTMYETEEDTMTDEDDKKRRKKSSRSPMKDHPRRDEAPKRSGKYEDDETLETYETLERPKAAAKSVPEPTPPPLGLATNPVNVPPPQPKPEPMEPQIESGDDTNPAPITTLEYDEQIDHGADVSVMESLGGPSLLIEKQRQAAATRSNPENVVPAEIIAKFGLNYEASYGMTREQTIQSNPIKFYTYVVKGLLEENEPEKVRLLDKLLAKYKGREDHLIQKLSVRYERKDDVQTPTIPEEDENRGFGNFTEAVNTTRESEATARVVESAKERAAATYGWPEKETKEAEPQDAQEVDREEESESGSEYSAESIDGTSPAVIAQVSELLNYVYGKTSVPGQIDRVSTIMRAYEGREAVLLELLETKALIKANAEKENAANLPSFLRNSPALQHAIDDGQVGENEQVSELSSPNMQNQQTVGGNIINDDISSMSGVSSPNNKDGDNGAKNLAVSFHCVDLSSSCVYVLVANVAPIPG